MAGTVTDQLNRIILKMGGANMSGTVTDLLARIEALTGNLTAPTTNIGTVTPPAIIVSTLFRSANTGNVPFVAQPFGTGAFQLQPADNTTTG